MKMLDILSANPPHDGANPVAVAVGQYGIRDSLRLQEVASPGQALVLESSSDGTKYLNVYMAGHPSGRTEFFGVLATKGGSPTMACAVTSSNDTTVSALCMGYAPCSLAPGYAVIQGQYMEPILAGANRGYFRPVTGGGRGPVQARESYDNTGGTEAQWVGCDVIPRNTGAGVVGSVGPGSAITTTTAETSYGLSVTLPAYSPRVGDIYRISGYGKANGNAAGSNTVKGYIDGIGSGVLFNFAATPSTGHIFRFSVDVRIDSIGASGTAAVSGHACWGAVDTATLKVQGAATDITIDTTQDNAILVAVTPNNNADTSTLMGLLVEKLNG